MGSFTDSLEVLEARADPDARDSFGQTPLMMAAKQGDEEAAQVLLDSGADAALQDSLGRSAGDMVKAGPVALLLVACRCWRATSRSTTR